MRGLVHVGSMAVPCYYFPPHRHASWEAVYYVAGTGVLTVGDREIPFSPGTLVFTPPGVEHSERSDEGYEDWFVVAQHCDAPETPQPLHDNEAGDLRRLIAMARWVYDVRPLDWQQTAESLIGAFEQLARSLAGSRPRSRWVGAMEERLVQHVADPSFRPGDAYRGLPASEDHLCRLFRSEVGETPSQYLLTRRIDRAKRLLYGGYSERQPVKVAAVMSGFADPYYFSRAFKKATGLSPARWAEATLREEGKDLGDTVAFEGPDTEIRWRKD